MTMNDNTPDQLCPDLDPVTTCFEKFDGLSEEMYAVIEQINKKCIRYTRAEEPTAVDEPLENAETPLIAQLHRINLCMETHLRSLEDLRMRII